MPLDPVDPKHVGMLNGLAHAVDEALNPDHAAGKGERKIGFMLTMFDFGDPEIDKRGAPSRFNHISNAEKLDVRTMLADILDRLEVRIAEESAAKVNEFVERQFEADKDAK